MRSSSIDDRQLWRIFILFNTIALPVWICIFYYYIFPHKIFDGTLVAAFYSFLIFAYGIVGGGLLGFSFVEKFFQIFKKKSSVLPFVFGIFAIIGVFWMAIIFQSFFDRIRYVETIKDSIQTSELGAPKVPNPKDLALAFNVFPKRKEVPFLISRASRTLAFTDNAEFFSSYMKKFVAALNYDDIKNRMLKDDASSKAQVHSFVALSIVQSNPGDTGYKAALSYLEKYGTANPIEDIHKIIIQFSKEFDPIFYSIFEDRYDREKLFVKKKLLNELEKELNLILDAASKNLDGSIFSLASSHIFQQAIDTSAQIAILNFLIDDSHLNKDDLRRDVLNKYRRILTLRERLVETNTAIWYTGPSTMTVFLYFDQLSGRKSSIAEAWVNIVDKIDSDLLKDINQEIVEVSAFEKYKDLDFWRLGTPLASKFRGSNAKTLIEEWIKHGW